MPDILKAQLWQNVKHERIGPYCATTTLADNQLCQVNHSVMVIMFCSDSFRHLDARR